jgi:hypothetical protein
MIKGNFLTMRDLKYNADMSAFQKSWLAPIYIEAGRSQQCKELRTYFRDGIVFSPHPAVLVPKERENTTAGV